MKLLFTLILLTLFSSLQIVSAQAPKKKNIAVIDLATRGGLSKSEVGTLTDRLRSMLVQTNAFNVVDRGLMEEVLAEQGFQMSGCTSTDCAVEAGKILGVEEMLSGTLGRLGKLYTVDIILIDVATSKIIKSFTRDYKGEIEGLIGLMKSLADELGGISAETSPPVVKKKEIKKYKLSINSDPSSGQVIINSKQVGATPFAVQVTQNTRLDIQVKKTNYRTFKKSLIVKKNETLNVKFEFTDAYKRYLAKQSEKNKKPEIKTAKTGSSKKWWWIGGGVVIAATAAYFLVPDNATSDTFPEPPARP